MAVGIHLAAIFQKQKRHMRTTILSILALLLLASCDSLLSSDNQAKGTSFESNAQTFYELTFKLPSDPDNQYVGLLIYTDDEHCKMRLVDDEMLKKNECIMADYTCHIEEKEGADDIGVMYYTPDQEDMPVLMWMWEKGDLSDMNEAPYLAFDLEDSDSWIQTQSFVEISLADMDEEYIAQFYGKDEPEYQMMLQGIQTIQEQSSVDIQDIASAEGDATLHLMVVANTDVSDIGPACDIDLRRIRNEFGGIAKALSMNLDETLVSGNNFGVDNVVEAIDGLNPEPNDVVVFVYTGHGFRFRDQEDVYPCLDLTSNAYDDSDSNYLQLIDIYNAIVEKNARLNLVLSDCCNSTIDIDQCMVRSNSLFSRSNTNFNLNKLFSLFMKSEGNIIATAASPGEVSWCGDNGGFFLLSFFESLRSQISALNQDEPSWDTVINNTISSAARKTDGSDYCKRQNGLKDVEVSNIQ